MEYLKKKHVLKYFFVHFFQPDHTVEMLKRKIQGKVQIPLDQQTIVDGENSGVILAGKCQECNLEDEGSRTLGYWNITNGTLLKLSKVSPLTVKPAAPVVTSELSRILIKTITGKTIVFNVKVIHKHVFYSGIHFFIHFG